MEESLVLRYFRPEAGYYQFSNFAPYGFHLDGLWWRTVEHYFQAQKFPPGPYREMVRTAATPAAAKALGQSRAHPLRPDWEQVKEEMMLRAYRAKFADPTLARLLLGTAGRELVEDDEHDAYWARSRSGRGRNRAGELLMQVRAELRSSRPPSPLQET
jgi:hypothetical protein